MAIIANQKGGKVVIHVVANTFTTNLSVLEVAGEVINSADISRVLWSGNTVVSRGDTLIIQTNSGTAGVFDLQAHGMSVSANGTANVTITTDGTTFVELKKQSTFTPAGM